MVVMVFGCSSLELELSLQNFLLVDGQQSHRSILHSFQFWSVNASIRSDSLKIKNAVIVCHPDIEHMQCLGVFRLAGVHHLLSHKVPDPISNQLQFVMMMMALILWKRKSQRTEMAMRMLSL
ncbi:hypothetical protein NC653_037940 [Populus alba x Populus x berolinensis]|uniref:Uncharacterized protein n=1 Tax=Populus alba x Populus x berolinensis TaxID=444605 RepID=A0AAD6LFS2_9ROSI|nr:hypothetical protein NC653_037940 [Populus alba x Populus x berolinensis]